MHASIDFLMNKRIDRTVRALQKNKFDARRINDTQDLLAYVDSCWTPGATCAVGGSVTLGQTGVLDALRQGKWTFYDRETPGADVREVFLKSFGADYYFTSSNAITEDGCLYNMDGRGNRVAALTFGPRRVVVVAGYNKIVPDVQAARMRNRCTAAPANANRLQCKTPCAVTGSCADCHSDQRICISELVTLTQQIPGRITVLILPESYGF